MSGNKHSGRRGVRTTAERKAHTEQRGAVVRLVPKTAPPVAELDIPAMPPRICPGKPGTAAYKAAHHRYHRVWTRWWTIGLTRGFLDTDLHYDRMVLRLIMMRDANNLIARGEAVPMADIAKMDTLLEKIGFTRGPGETAGAVSHAQEAFNALLPAQKITSQPI